MSSRPLAAADAGAVGDILVVIPTYNERENLTAVVTQVLGLGQRFRVMVVDDNSPDGTGQIANELVSMYSDQLSVLHRERKQGLGRAYVAGFLAALDDGAPFIAQMDADLSHRPEDLETMAAALTGDVDLVLGSRYVDGGATQGWPWHRKLISRAGGMYAGAVLGLPIRDLTGGFKIWRRELLQSIDLSNITSDGYSFQIETTYRAMKRGARVVQIPVVFHDRVVGKSKLSRRVVLEAAVRVWGFRFRR